MYGSATRYVVLCEVVGPGKIPPGQGMISGSFEYVMIEPAGGVRAVLKSSRKKKIASRQAFVI